MDSQILSIDLKHFVKAVNPNQKLILMNGAINIIEFLKKLDGDFALKQITNEYIIIQNSFSCPCRSENVCNNHNVLCDRMEKTLNKVIKSINMNLSVGIVECSCEKQDHCQLIISYDAY